MAKAQILIKQELAPASSLPVLLAQGRGDGARAAGARRGVGHDSALSEDAHLDVVGAGNGVGAHRQLGTVERVAVMHGDAPDIDEFLDNLSSLYPRDEIMVGDIGAVIGTHSGPRVMGVVFQTPR